MKILVSACLLGENCKYNGGNNYDERFAKFLAEHEVIPVCPEVLGGLPVPRKPAELVNGIVTNCEGVSVDAEFRSGAAKALEIGIEKGAAAALLKSGSPSCGHGEIYDGSFSHKKIPGDGVFAELLLKNGFRVITSEEVLKQG